MDLIKQSEGLKIVEYIVGFPVIEEWQINDGGNGITVLHLTVLVT
jgi:hypothetical protein